MIKFVFILFFLLTTIFVAGQSALLKLWYEEPAEKWTEALPVGNGRQGAMIFGDPLNEHLQLNENTLYSGEPSSTFKNVNIQHDLPLVVKMLEEEKYVEADKYVTDNWLGRLRSVAEQQSMLARLFIMCISISFREEATWRNFPSSGSLFPMIKRWTRKFLQPSKVSFKKDPRFLR